MKAKELRLGNYIIANGSIEKINYITPATLGYGEKEFAPICTSDYKYFEPIPLTEEWLLKFGFKNDEFISYRWYAPNDISLVYDLDDNCVCISDSWEFGKIKYVHELQNLYFALTNQELKLK